MERGKEYLEIILRAVFLVACVALVIIGQRSSGWGGLALQLLGLLGVIILLFLYNRGFVVTKNPDYREDTKK